MTQLCSVCLVDHPIEMFAIGRSRQQKPISYCREMGALQSYERTRIRKRNEDLIAFLRHNADIQQRYRDEHPEIKEAYNDKRRLDPDARMQNCVLNSAKQRQIPVTSEDIAVMTSKQTLPCTYCGHCQFGRALNGLDRVDSKLGYSDDNTVSSCDVCNYMKHTYSRSAFHEKVASIVTHNKLDKTVPESKPRITFGQAKCVDGPKRGPADKSMLLTEQEFEDIVSRSCHYCGTSSAIGMDRKDSEQPYTVQNVVACCTMCNYMKKDMTPKQFLNQCLRVYVYNK